MGKMGFGMGKMGKIMGIPHRHGHVVLGERAWKNGNYCQENRNYRQEKWGSQLMGITAGNWELQAGESGNSSRKSGNFQCFLTQDPLLVRFDHGLEPGIVGVDQESIEEPSDLGKTGNSVREIPNSIREIPKFPQGNLKIPSGKSRAGSSGMGGKGAGILQERDGIGDPREIWDSDSKDFRKIVDSNSRNSKKTEDSNPRDPSPENSRKIGLMVESQPNIPRIPNTPNIPNKHSHNSQ